MFNGTPCLWINDFHLSKNWRFDLWRIYILKYINIGKVNCSGHRRRNHRRFFVKLICEKSLKLDLICTRSETSREIMTMLKCLLYSYSIVPGFFIYNIYLPFENFRHIPSGVEKQSNENSKSTFLEPADTGLLKKITECIWDACFHKQYRHIS